MLNRFLLALARSTFLALGWTRGEQAVAWVGRIEGYRTWEQRGPLWWPLVPASRSILGVDWGAGESISVPAARGPLALPGEQVVPSEALPGIQRFSDAKINAAIDKALLDVPEGKKGAVVAYADLSGAHLAVVGKIGEHWSVVGVLGKPFGGRLEAEAAVRFAW